MANKKHSLLWIIGLGGAGYLIYDWWKNKQSTPPATTSTTQQMTDTQPTTTIQPPVSQLAPISQSAAVLQTQPVDLSGKPLPTGISQDMYNTVYEWAISTGKPPIKTMANALIPSEYQGMYNLIKNVWPSGSATAEGTAFWNQLRTKYDPLHQWW